MNTNHYPSLELCKKLTEIGFPKTYYIVNTPRGNFEISYQYYYPSVMEMLDVIPKFIVDGPKQYTLNIICEGICIGGEIMYEVKYSESRMLHGNYNYLPNALAEMILWLHENNYISFSK